MAASENKGPAPLARYRQKRDFARTPEPDEAPAPAEGQGRAGAPIFVVQKHWASRLHYDFRLELDGVLLSWAVPKGPSFDPAKSSMAIHVEDHPLDYAAFEGTIPAKQYGAGKVIVWDRGTWEPVGDPAEGMARGKLLFRLHGEKLAGLWELVRIAKPGDRQDPWMLFKKKDEWARPLAEYDVIAALPDSVVAAPLGPVEAREPRAARGAAAKARPGGAARPGDPAGGGAAGADRAAARHPGGDAAAAGRLGDRDQVRRLPADGAHRGRPGEARHPQRPRLDAQDAGARRGDRGARCRAAWLDGEIVVHERRRRA